MDEETWWNCYKYYTVTSKLLFLTMETSNCKWLRCNAKSQLGWLTTKITFQRYARMDVKHTHFTSGNETLSHSLIS